MVKVFNCFNYVCTRVYVTIQSNKVSKFVFNNFEDIYNLFDCISTNFF